MGDTTPTHDCCNSRGTALAWSHTQFIYRFLRMPALPIEELMYASICCEKVGIFEHEIFPPLQIRQFRLSVFIEYLLDFGADPCKNIPRTLVNLMHYEDLGTPSLPRGPVRHANSSNFDNMAINEDFMLLEYDIWAPCAYLALRGVEGPVAIDRKHSAIRTPGLEGAAESAAEAHEERVSYKSIADGLEPQVKKLNVK
ncbi:hypothetical protein BKA66DRAFT_444410 [Pyrenochaeta sp. MPI-SDFR-AT-0127]|nr:hypothetical protein BKA66DRAFT_444410 [Pyrenochaeta sp. MPI-SDFR-AT-0127]